ncbi:MAG TPA: CDP-6-deoxy-delta-3,4-glucoseen reductase [Gammaproteobacteria bacterium]
MAYTIRLEPSGHQFSARADENLLDAAARHGLTLPYGCRNGQCGSCKARLRDGRVAYPDPEALPGLTADELQAGYALLCQARPASDLALEVSEIQTADGLRPQRFAARVAGLERLNHDVMRVQLQLPRDRRLPFFAGQYIDIVTRSGHRRAFSLANPPHDDRTIDLHVRYVAGGEFTEHVFNRMRVGEVLQVDGPRGTFFLREQGSAPVLLVAGGTGFAPVKAILEHAFHVGLERPLQLYWGVRAVRDLYLAALPERWAREHANFGYVPVLSEPRPEDAWGGRTGFVHEALLADHPDPAAFEVYACGPPVMVKAVHAALTAAGLPPARFFSDAFEFGALSDGKK